MWNNSSAMAGVTPKPAAAFSALAMARSMRCDCTISFRWSATILRPGEAKMSPTKRMFMLYDKLAVSRRRVANLLLHSELRQQPARAALGVVRRRPDGRDQHRAQ